MVCEKCGDRGLHHDSLNSYINFEKFVKLAT